jgi:multidrug efflux system membrane fusion protein
MSRRRWMLLGAGALALLILAWLFSPGRSRTLAASHEAAPGIIVDVATATRADVPVYFIGLGTVQAFYTVKIDQALAMQAKDNAQLTNAKQDLERYMVLAPQDLASKQTVDTQRALVAQLQAQLKSDEAAIENARTQLSYTTIVSPINGRTGIRLVDPGNIVHAADTTGIVMMTQVQPIAVIFTLPEASLGELSEVMRAGSVEVAALSQDAGKELDRGAVSLIDNEIDQTTGTIRVKAIFPNAEQRLWPGEFVNARVHLRTVHNAITIPPAALQRGPDGPFAYVVKADSTVDTRLLRVSGNTEETVVVESGLEPGERVAVSNLYRLQPGVRVRVNDTGPARVARSAEPAAQKAPAP